MPTNNTALRRRNELTLVNRHPRLRVDLRLLRRILRTALADPVFLAQPPKRCAARASALAALDFELVCDLVNSAEIVALNRQHLGHTGPTDVISFDYGPPPGAPPDASWLRGEVVVCLDVAHTQARQYHTTWTCELVRYLVHGLLHIRGYDDLASPARRIMKREENRLVKQLSAQFRFGRRRGSLRR